MVPSTYLRLLIFLPAVLIPACASSSPDFLMVYSAYKLNKQGDNTQPWCTPFLLLNQSVAPCPVVVTSNCGFLTCLHISQETRKLVWLLFYIGLFSGPYPVKHWKLMLSNCGAGEDLKVLFSVKRPNLSILKEINPNTPWKDRCWIWSSNTMATWCEELTHWKRPWCWGRLKAKGERGSRGWRG